MTKTAPEKTKVKKEGPVCAYCGNPLKRQYGDIIVNVGERPTVYDGKRWSRKHWDGLPILEIVGKPTTGFFTKQGQESIKVWVGYYQETARYFCKGPCADKFAMAAVRGGMRMPNIKGKIYLDDYLPK